MKGKRTLKETVRTALVVVALVLVVSTAGAVTSGTLSVDKLSLFSSETAESDFDVDHKDTTVRGFGKLAVDMTLVNGDSSSHSANVTVQLLDSNGDVIATQSKETGTVAGGDSFSGTWTFQRPGLLMNYESSRIIVDQQS